MFFLCLFFSKFFFLRFNKAAKYISGSVLSKERALRRSKGRKFFFIRRLHGFERKLYAAMQKYYGLRFAGFLRNAFNAKLKITKFKLRRSGIFKRIFFKKFFSPIRKKQLKFYRNNAKKKRASIIKVNAGVLKEVLHKPIVSMKTGFVFVLDVTKILLFFL